MINIKEYFGDKNKLLLLCPLPPITWGITYKIIASKVAKKYSLSLEDWNLNGGTDDSPDWRPVYIAECTKKTKSSAVTQLEEAYKELETIFS